MIKVEKGKYYLTTGDEVVLCVDDNKKYKMWYKIYYGYILKPIIPSKSEYYRVEKQFIDRWIKREMSKEEVKNYKFYPKVPSKIDKINCSDII